VVTVNSLRWALVFVAIALAGILWLLTWAHARIDRLERRLDGQDRDDRPGS
jgi:hypothetical protein